MDAPYLTLHTGKSIAVFSVLPNNNALVADFIRSVTDSGSDCEGFLDFAHDRFFLSVLR
jgi:hypothetical protein